MKYFKIKGLITHFFETKTQYPRYDGAFQKKNILLKSESEVYTITFTKNKIKLLNNCKIGYEIEVNVILKGREWNFKQSKHSINELVCSNLTILSNTIFDDFIYYQGQTYTPIKSYINGNLQLSLINIKTKNLLELTHNHEFPNRELNQTHVLLKVDVDNEIKEQLYEKGILERGSWVKSKNKEGFICKVLILKLFDSNILYPKGYFNDRNSLEDSEFLNVPTVRNEYYSEQDYSNFDDEIDYTHWNDDLDTDQQSEEFWNQF